MNYLTDTSVVSRIMNGEPAALSRLSKFLATDLLFTSVITEAEIEFGLLNAGQLESQRQRDNFVSTFEIFVDVLPVTREVSRAYAEVKYSLKRAGRTIPENDMWISAIAVANGMTVVHRDKHFAFVPGLAHEDWSPDSQR